jgi:hypothetical protein
MARWTYISVETKIYQGFSPLCLDSSVQFLFNAKDAELKKCPAIHSPEGLHIHRNKDVSMVFPVGDTASFFI